MSRRIIISGILTLLVLQVTAASAWAKNERKPWEKLSNCKQIPWQYNDGDSFRIRCNSQELVLRLYFVDAPETSLSNAEKVREQRDYFGITLDQVLDAGIQAKKRRQVLLQQPFFVWTKWSTAGGRGKEPRYYGMAIVQEKDLGETLTREGLARVKGVFVIPPSGIAVREYVKRLRGLEDAARKQKLGAWTNSKEELRRNRDL